MLPLFPIATDEASIADSARAMEDQVSAMQEHLDSYRPTVALGSDGRLSYVLTQDPASSTVPAYPRAGAKPLFGDGDTSARLARAKGMALDLAAKLAPYTVQTLPSATPGQSLQAHAIPLGFLPVRGCDANWTGKDWHVADGVLPLSLANGQRDLAIKGKHFEAITGVLFLRLKVAYGKADEGLDPVTVEAATLELRKPAELPRSTDLIYNPASEAWEGGTVITPLNYLLAPEGNRKAPRVLRIIGGTVAGEFPTAHQWMRPISGGGITPP